jgi:hypothetical protein
MPLVILHHLLNVSVQIANKRELKKINKLVYLKIYYLTAGLSVLCVSLKAYVVESE